MEHLEDLPLYSSDTAGRPEEPASPVLVETESPAETATSGIQDLPPAYDDVASDDEQRGRSRTRH